MPIAPGGYTAGPWKHEWLSKDQAPTMHEDEPDVWPIIIHVDGGPSAGSEIATIDHYGPECGQPSDSHGDEAMANAKLMAASPDLYEELHVLKETWEAGRTVVIEPGTVWAARILEVLAKAVG